jgi:nucleoside-triphosphatase THEP1
LIVGFTVLGTELYNPRIRNYLSRSHLRKVPAALELAFESLPFIIANLPDARTFLRKPVSVIQMLIVYAEQRFRELSSRQALIFIVTGNVSEGKTTLLADLSIKLQKKGITVGGFYSPRVMDGDKTTGYDIVDANTGESREFLREAAEKEKADIGKYRVNKQTLLQGHELLSPVQISDKKVVIIDEVGRLELDGEGWRDSLESLLKLPGIILVFSVRRDFLEPVKKELGIANAEIFDVSKSKSQDLSDIIINKINFNHTTYS